MFLPDGTYIKGNVSYYKGKPHPFRAQVRYAGKNIASYFSTRDEAIDYLKQLFEEHGSPTPKFKKNLVIPYQEPELTSAEVVLAFNASIRRSRERA